MTDRAEIRADFIKRLFAVAISIGFATSFVDMDWVKTGLRAWPEPHDWERMAIISTGLLATVLSWDGYLASIDAKPLNGAARFTIDIILVFIYMFFLISSKNPNLWLPILALIYCLYVIWDVLTVREHTAYFDASLIPPRLSGPRRAEYRAPIGQVVQVYVRGFLDRQTTNPGPIISLSWALYFVSLALLSYFFLARSQVFVMCAFAATGLILYRQDKSRKFGTNAMPGFGMVLRTILIVSLVVLAALYFCRYAVAKS